MRQELAGWGTYMQGQLFLLGSLFAGPGILENINPLEVVGKRPSAYSWGGGVRNHLSRWLPRGHEWKVSHYVLLSVSFPLLLPVRLY